MGEFLARTVEPPDLSVAPADYFGAHPDETENAAVFGIVPRAGRQQELYRVSYLFLLVFGSDDHDKQFDNEYGGMQLRAETHLWAENGEIPVRLQKIIQQTAHKAASVFNTSVETSYYGVNEWGPGYLEGFDPWENAENYDNWEVEPVSQGEVHNPPGTIDWTTEIYLDVEGLQYANLSGVATGLSNPWSATTTTEPGREPIHVAPHKWRIDTYESRPDYYELRPPAHTDARDRYREGEGRGKKVYINGAYVATTDNKGRAWLKKEYSRGDGWNHGSDPVRWSRKGLVESPAVDGATWSALRKGGVLYLTGETRDGIFLSTRRHRPEGWKAGDPDSVPVDMKVDEGAPPRSITLLRLDEPGDPLDVLVREDREVIKHLGASSPPYEHPISDRFRHPGFRPVEPYHVSTPDQERTGDQSGLDDFEGAER